MKKFLGIILALLCVVLGLCAVNYETDFFSDIGTYIPALEEKHPELTERIEKFSKDISGFIHQIPTPSELRAMITGEELPIDPSDVATNAYIKDSPMLTFNPNENISMRVTDYGTLEMFGIVSSRDKAWLVVCFNTPDGETIEQVTVSTNDDYTFYKDMDIPETEHHTLDVNVYTGPEPYGNFVSWVYDYVTIEDFYGDWQIKPSPVHDNNVTMYERDKSISDALESTLSIQSEYANMKSIAEQVSAGYLTDYDRAAAIHDWVCSYLYYDNDALSSGETAPYAAASVVNSRRAVCLGYATLYATLCRSIGIPCNVVSGYALGVGSGDTRWTDENLNTTEQNHAWNEVYVDGRWVIVDPTWDSQNKYENGEFVEGSGVSRLYFDANLDFFSANHKIIEYSLRR